MDKEMEVDNNSSSGKQSDSSDEDDEENNNALMQKAAELETSIRENHYDYDSHVNLIATYRQLVDFDKLREARNCMYQYFPLTPTLWVEWLSDEVKLSETKEEKENTRQLFEKAIKDYLSVEVWLEYIKFIVPEAGETPDGIENARKIFERALSTAGLHVIKGAEIWDAFVEFEVVVLSLIPCDDKQATETQLKRIGNLFKRQLSCPLMDMNSTFESFNMWLVDNLGSLDSKLIDRQLVETTYKKASEKLDAIEKFEKGLASDPLNYKEYIEHEKSKSGSPSRVLCLYERLICEQCLHEPLWLEYIDYVDTVLKDGKLAAEIARRSLRNCSWSGTLSQILLRLLEKTGAPHSEVVDAVEKSLAPGLKQGTAIRDVWISFLEYMRRRFDAPDISLEDETKRLEELRAAFERALLHINAVPDADPECLVAQYWARIEAKSGKDLEKSRQLWTDIMADPLHRTAAMWLEYINLEVACGDSKHLRKLFPRALQQTTDWPESIYSAWLNHERDEGTLESYLNCVAKCTAKLEQVKKQREDQVAKQEQEYGERGADNRKSRRAGLGYEKPERKVDRGKTREAATASAPVSRKRALVEKKTESGGSPEKRMKVDEKEDTKNIVDKLLSENNKVHGVTVKHDSSKDNRTIFVSNLDYTTDDGPLREIFGPDGNITDLRLVKDFKGRSKGYCYIEFQTVEMAQKALKRDRQLISGRPMFVSRCDPDKETRGTGFRFATSLEKNKLFVRGLPFSTTEEELRELFGKYGCLKDVRLVTFRNGHSKGLAYVDFEDEISATQAILKADGMTIQDKQISVAISNPPGRQKPDAPSAAPMISSLGAGKRDTGRGGRTQISFVPRILQVPKNGN